MEIICAVRRRSVCCIFSDAFSGNHLWIFFLEKISKRKEYLRTSENFFPLTCVCFRLKIPRSGDQWCCLHPTDRNIMDTNFQNVGSVVSLNMLRTVEQLMDRWIWNIHVHICYLNLLSIFCFVLFIYFCYFIFISINRRGCFCHFCFVFDTAQYFSWQYYVEQLVFYVFIHITQLPQCILA